MPNRIRLSPLAEADLLDIALYVAQDSQAASDSLIDEIDQQFSLLLTQPEMGRLRPELRAKLRSFLVKSYIVFYEPDAEGIFIVRVLHGARDIENHF